MIKESSLPQSLPTVLYVRDATDAEVLDAVREWCDQHGRADLADVLAAILAARHTNATDIDAYVATCFENGIRSHWLKRAEAMLNHSPRRHGSPARVHQGKAPDYGTPIIVK